MLSEILGVIGFITFSMISLILFTLGWKMMRNEVHITERQVIVPVFNRKTNKVNFIKTKVQDIVIG